MGLSNKHSDTLPFLQKLSVWATRADARRQLPENLRPLKSIFNKSTYSRYGRTEITFWDSPHVHPKIIEAARRIDNQNIGCETILRITNWVLCIECTEGDV